MVNLVKPINDSVGTSAMSFPLIVNQIKLLFIGSISGNTVSLLLSSVKYWSCDNPSKCSVGTAVI